MVARAPWRSGRGRCRPRWACRGRATARSRRASSAITSAAEILSLRCTTTSAPKPAEIVEQVEGEAVVIVDQDDHGRVLLPAQGLRRGPEGVKATGFRADREGDPSRTWTQPTVRNRDPFANRSLRPHSFTAAHQRSRFRAALKRIALGLRKRGILARNSASDRRAGFDLETPDFCAPARPLRPITMSSPALICAVARSDSILGSTKRMHHTDTFQYGQKTDHILDKQGRRSAEGGG